MADLSKADTDYLRAMIEHHRSALQMSNDYLKTPAVLRLAKVTALAQGVIKAQTAEIAQMQGWLKDAAPAQSGGSSSRSGMKM